MRSSCGPCGRRLERAGRLGDQDGRVVAHPMGIRRTRTDRPRPRIGSS